MSKAFPILVALLMSPAWATDVPAVPSVPAGNKDSWTSEDKGYHLAGGAVLSTVSTIKWESRAVGFAVGCGAGVAFELLAPGFKSYKDAVVTCLGAAFGAVIGGWHLQRNGIIYRKEF